MRIHKDFSVCILLHCVIIFKSESSPEREIIIIGQACNYCASVAVRITGNHKVRTKLLRLRTKAQQTQQWQRRRNSLKSLNSPRPRKNQEEEVK